MNKKTDKQQIIDQAVAAVAEQQHFFCISAFIRSCRSLHCFHQKLSPLYRSFDFTFVIMFLFRISEVRRSKKSTMSRVLLVFGFWNLPCSNLHKLLIFWPHCFWFVFSLFFVCFFAFETYLQQAAQANSTEGLVVSSFSRIAFYPASLG